MMSQEIEENVKLSCQWDKEKNNSNKSKFKAFNTSTFTILKFFAFQLNPNAAFMNNPIEKIYCYVQSAKLLSIKITKKFQQVTHESFIALLFVNLFFEMQFSNIYPEEYEIRFTNHRELDMANCRTNTLLAVYLTYKLATCSFPRGKK